MRTWDAYVNLDATVRNMLTSLRAVAELQNPSLRERHWGQLLVATKTETSTQSFVVCLSVGGWVTCVKNSRENVQGRN